MTDLAYALRRAEPAELSAHLPALRAALEQQRHFRVHQLAQLTTASLLPVRHRGDPWDEVALAIRTAAMTALSDIEAALRRIEVGRFGLCEGCDTAIPLERLEILPMASLCMRCQYAHETGRR